MADRRRQVILLIGSRFDGLYLPNGSLTTPSGLVPSVRTPCTDCGGVELHDDFGHTIRRQKGRGTIRDRYQRPQPCTRCGGGRDPGGKLVPGTGYIDRDPMDATNIRIGSTATKATARPRRTVTCDGCGGDGVGKRRLDANGQPTFACKVCGGEGRRDQHIFELHLTTDTEAADDVDRMSDAIDERNRSGSYHELDLALAGIAHHINKPPRFAALTVYAVEALRLLDELWLPPAARTQDELQEAELLLAETALAYIASRMPDPIRVPAEVRANAKLLAEHRTRAKGRGAGPRALEQRAREWRQHAREGRSPQWIAAEYSVHVSTVYGVVNGRATS